tara:strand:+ start:1215 stop:1382 length:168 start_codon:yes stop_codon:yes gene_type:complete
MQTNNNKYLPQSIKNQSPLTKSLFTQKKELLPKDNKQLHREKFRQQLKNNIQKKK